MSSEGDATNFETGDAGSSATVPTQIGSIKKGGYCMLKGHPCKVTEYSTAKPGKHGSAKATMVGVDIFTNKKYEDVGPTACNITVPIVSKKEYQVMNVDGNDISLLLDDGGLKEDLQLPADEEELCENIRKGWISAQANKRDLYVSVIAACGQEKIIECREK